MMGPVKNIGSLTGTLIFDRKHNLSEASSLERQAVKGEELNEQQS